MVLLAMLSLCGMRLAHKDGHRIAQALMHWRMYEYSQIEEGGGLVLAAGNKFC